MGAILVPPLLYRQSYCSNQSTVALAAPERRLSGYVMTTATSKQQVDAWLSNIPRRTRSTAHLDVGHSGSCIYSDRTCWSCFAADSCYVHSRNRQHRPLTTTSARGIPLASRTMNRMFAAAAASFNRLEDWRVAGRQGHGVPGAWRDVLRPGHDVRSTAWQLNIGPWTRHEHEAMFYAPRPSTRTSAGAWATGVDLLRQSVGGVSATPDARTASGQRLAIRRTRTARPAPAAPAAHHRRCRGRRATASRRRLVVLSSQ